MFKKTLLAFAIAGVSATASAATVYTSTTAAVVGDVEKALETATPAAGDALGTDGNFGGAGSDNCAALAKALGVSVTNPGVDGKVSTAGDDFALAASGAAGDTATFAAGAGINKTVVEMTNDNTCTATVKPTFSSTSLKDGLEYSTVKAVEIQPVLIAGIGGYKDEDTITIDVSGAKIDLGETTAPTLTVTGAAGTSTGLGNISFTVLDISENQVRFTLQATDALADYVLGGAVLKLAGVYLDSSDLTASSAVSAATYATNTSGTKFDPADSAVVTTLVSQYKSEVTTLLDAQIDVGADRQQFAGNSTSDSLVVATEKQTTGLELTPATMTYTITGDFSWMLDDDIDKNEDGKLTSAEIANAVAFTAVGGGDDAAKSFAVNSDLNELTVTTTVNGGAVDASGTVTFTVPGYDDGDLENLMVPVQEFSVAVDVQDNKAFSKDAVNMESTTAVGAGAWTLNGSVVYVPYVPFGPNTQPILRHTNKGNRTGDITVRYMVEGEDTKWQPLPAAGVTDAKPGVRNMLSLVDNALKAEGYDSSKEGFKVALEIVTNVPSADVFVYGGAKISADGQDRIHLITTKTNQ